MNSLPISFRVIGCGDYTADLIEEIRGIGYNGLQSDVINVGEAIIPTDQDEMIIFLCTEYFDTLEGLLNAFHKAGILTIVISTDKLNISDTTYDSLTIVNRDEIVSVVKTLLNPVFIQGRINYDFNDLACTLRNSGKFVTFCAYGRGKNRMSDAVESVSQLLSINECVEDLSLIIHFNEKAIDPPVSIKEIPVIAEYVNLLMESVNVIWAMYNDNDLDSTTVGLSVIASGKNLNIKR